MEKHSEGPHIDFNPHINPKDFNEKALTIFRFQAEYCEPYRIFLNHLQCSPSDVTRIEEIPFLPISFFKNFAVHTHSVQPQNYFESSGTTGQICSRHYYQDLAHYESSFLAGFRHFYGEPQDYCFLALLPHYLERKNSSLVYMVQRLMETSGHPSNGYYLNNHASLHEQLQKLEQTGTPTLLFGVSFALLDFLEDFKPSLKSTIVMETGGMKGRRKEILKSELHDTLAQGFGTPKIHSEYGMTELFSQAYSSGDNRFQTPPWMKVGIRQLNDPLSHQFNHPQSGALQVIDLANVNSCSFIATEDLGRLHADGSFEVLGRIDNSDIRGCNLMVGAES